MYTKFSSLKSIYFKLFFLTAALSVVATSCNHDDNEVITPSVDNSITLDLSKFDLSDGKETTGGKVWKDTYTADQALEIGIFKFSHNANPSWGSWSGFTISNSMDNTDHKNWTGWSENQWGTMPQGGSEGVGTPFLVSYTNHIPSEGTIKARTVTDISQFSSSVEITDEAKTYVAKSANFAISPWSYYGILNGDSFARAFKAGDYFAVKVYGFDKNKIPTNNANPVTHYLVDFRNGVGAIDTTWKNADLSALGNVKYLVFFLETTDVGQYGANTALYFTMDKLKVEPVN